MFKRKSKKWSRRNLCLLFERLELYITSGLTLDKSLALASQGISPMHQKSLERVSDSVQTGGRLSAALLKEIRIHATLAGLIERGEMSGQLGKSIGQARLLMEREDELTRKCTSALVYPVVIGIFAIILTIGLVRGVMPQIIPMLKSLHVKLPLLTRIVMALSEGFLAYGLYALCEGIITVIVGAYSYRRWPQLRNLCQILLLKLPIIGRLVFLYFVSLYLHSLGSLIESGMPVSAAYMNTSSALSFLPLRHELLKQNQEVSEGVYLSSVLANIKRIPVFVPPLISAGELSGSLGISLMRAASIIDRDVEHALKKLTSLIEPLMMAAMGITVGLISVSIMMPIYDISRVLQH